MLSVDRAALVDPVPAGHVVAVEVAAAEGPPAVAFFFPLPTPPDVKGCRTATMVLQSALTLALSVVACSTGRSNVPRNVEYSG